jgi:hypothetical protein
MQLSDELLSGDATLGGTLVSRNAIAELSINVQACTYGMDLNKKLRKDWVDGRHKLIDLLLEQHCGIKQTASGYVPCQRAQPAMVAE